VKLLALSSALLCVAFPAAAQETYGTIRVTTKLLEGGFKSTTVLDPDKRTAEETVTDAAGKPLRKTTYTLDERNISVGAIFADAKGKVIYKASYQRDGVGRVVESMFRSADDRYLGKRSFGYGAGDAVARVDDYDAQGQIIARPQAAGKSSTKKRR